MSEDLQKLRDIGAQQIYEKTHIPVREVEAIIFEEFDELSRVQFVGFVSILEREYEVNLSGLKTEALKHFEEKEAQQSVQKEEKNLFVVPPRQKSYKGLYAFFALLFVFGAAYFFFSGSTSTQEQQLQKTEQTEPQLLTQEDEVAVEEPNEDIITDKNSSVAEETNTTQPAQEEQNASEPLEVQEVQEKKVEKSFEIVADKKVWLGYIDLSTHKKYQKTFRGSLKLDPSKEWLLRFGHDYIHIVLNGKRYDYKQKKVLRLYYSNGRLKKINAKEFKKLNRGRSW